MFKIMEALNKEKYQPRVYVTATTDRLAATKVQQHEQRWASEHCMHTPPPSSTGTTPSAPLDAALRVIPRSREVGQPWASSAATTTWAALFSLRCLLLDKPHLLLANGPGTCLPLCLLARGLCVLRLLNCKVVFVESIARTQKLSMTGRILYTLHASDVLFVQWQQLTKVFPRSVCAGRVY
jgi:beta-1,4-N-acetylglucosaminyltransferase